MTLTGGIGRRETGGIADVILGHLVVCDSNILEGILLSPLVKLAGDSCPLRAHHQVRRHKFEDSPREEYSFL